MQKFISKTIYLVWKKAVYYVVGYIKAPLNFNENTKLWNTKSTYFLWSQLYLQNKTILLYFSHVIAFLSSNKISSE